MNLLYLLCFTFPVTGFIASTFGDWASYLSLAIFPSLILSEIVVGRNSRYPAPINEGERNIFKTLITLMEYIYGTLVIYLIYHIGSRVSNFSLLSAAAAGIAFSSSIAVTLNVGHDLTHKKNKISFYIGRVFLTFFGFYHFDIIHVIEHHNIKYTGTKRDVAVAPLGMNFWHYFLLCWLTSYQIAFNVERSRLEKTAKNGIGLRNWVVLGTILFASIQVSTYFLVGLQGWIFLALSNLAAMVLFHGITYIQHYGLARIEAGGKIPRYNDHYTWDCDYVISNYFFLCLPRHVHHHDKMMNHLTEYKNVEGSMVLPFGYLTSLLLSTFPPLWFRIMDKRALEKISSAELSGLKKGNSTKDAA